MGEYLVDVNFFYVSSTHTKHAILTYNGDQGKGQIIFKNWSGVTFISANTGC